jgi:hypothetical protein
MAIFTDQVIAVDILIGQVCSTTNTAQRSFSKAYSCGTVSSAW